VRGTVTIVTTAVPI